MNVWATTVQQALQDISANGANGATPGFALWLGTYYDEAGSFFNYVYFCRC